MKTRRLRVRPYVGPPSLGAAAKEAAASVAAGKCPLCRKAKAVTNVQVGPVFVKLCEKCSQPLWHAMGLLGWVQELIR